MKSLVRIIIPVLLAVVLGLSGCETVRPPSRGIEGGLSHAQTLEKEGQYTAAAQEYLQLSEQAEATQARNLKLQAAHAWILAHDINQAERILGTLKIDPQDLNTSIKVRMLRAQISMLNQRPLEALENLPVLPTDMPLNLRARTHELRARAYNQAGNHLESARERILLEPLLSDPESIRRNHRQIWDSLNQLTPLALNQLRMSPPPDVLSGWMELAAIGKTSLHEPEQFELDIAQWQANYANHPAMQDILPELVQRYRSQKRPEKLALLLPASGKLAVAASAIREGFLAAYYQNKSNHARTTIRIYDTSAPGVDIWTLYQRAVRDGAELIIGPLDKERVATLSRAVTLPVPILTLNTLEQPAILADGFYQFGLNPEDEARQVAERAALEGLTKSLAIVPRGEWGDRMLQAFSTRFQELGGEVLEQERYEFSNSDFSAPLRKLLNLDESDNRNTQLKYLLNEDIKFEPRRRQDVDFVFMAAFPRQARLIVPQLRFFHASDIPVYTTSHAYDSNEGSRENRDLDGVILCDSAWNLADSADAPPLRKALTEYWPNTMNQYPRLFALGIDAYQLMPYLKWLHEQPSERIDGVSGYLYLNKQNQVMRTLQWARISNGRAYILQPVTTQPVGDTTEGLTLSP